MVKDRLLFFSSLQYVHENASIAYSPASQTEFNAFPQLAAARLIRDSGTGTAVNQIAVPKNVPVPFRNYLANTRLDSSPSDQSRWLLRASSYSYINRHAILQ